MEYFKRSPLVLLQNLRFLILATAVLLVQCFNTPSLLSLDVSLEDEGLLLYKYLQRSSPPLETLKMKMAILPNKDLLPNILRELYGTNPHNKTLFRTFLLPTALRSTRSSADK